MKYRDGTTRRLRMLGATVLTGYGLMAGPAFAGDTGPQDFDLKLGGWVRTWLGFNLDKNASTGYDKWYDPSMVRNELLIDADAKTGPASWKFIGRFDREIETDYLRQLRKLNDIQSPHGSVGEGHDYLEQYNTTKFSQAVREGYVNFDATDRFNFRLGKQQIVWGESDFFHAMDVISGFDYRSRLFFENNEEYRKPLIMGKITANVPELRGNLEMFVRPGLDSDEAIGNSYNIEGGRWSPTPYQGVDFTAFTQYNYHHPSGSKDDPTYGFRWKGDAGDVGYSLAYIRTFNPDPVINPAQSATSAAFGVNGAQFYKVQPTNQVLGDWIFPQIDVFGASANYYVAPIDSVISAEFTYTPNKPYNFGQLNSSLPGWGGIAEKDTMVGMIRVDKNIDLQGLLGTNRPSLSSFQLFDTYIPGLSQNDQIVEFASFGHGKHKHSTMATWFIMMNYLGDTINPSFVVGVDASNGGGFLIPAVDFTFGDNWRLKLEADLFWDGDHKSASPTNANGSHQNLLGVSENKTSMFGWFHGDDQFVARLTRQF